MCDRFGEVADRLVRLLEQPFADAGDPAGERTQQRGRNDLARLAAGEKVNGPRGIGARGAREVTLQCVDFRERRGARIELGKQAREVPHPAVVPGVASGCASAAPSWSSPYSVVNGPAPRP